MLTLPAWLGKATTVRRLECMQDVTLWTMVENPEFFLLSKYRIIHLEKVYESLQTCNSIELEIYQSTETKNKVKFNVNLS